MLTCYINPSHVTEEYEQRLQDSARNARFSSVRRGSVVLESVGRLINGLSEFVHGRRPSTIEEPADVQWVMD